MSFKKESAALSLISTYQIPTYKEMLGRKDIPDFGFHRPVIYIQKIFDILSGFTNKPSKPDIYCHFNFTEGHSIKRARNLNSRIKDSLPKRTNLDLPKKSPWRLDL